MKISVVDLLMICFIVKIILVKILDIVLGNMILNMVFNLFVLSVKVFFW